MTQLRIVYFDLGDVVCRFIPERRLAALDAVSPLSQEAIHAAVWLSGFSDACDNGDYSGDEMYEQLCQRLNVSLSRSELQRLWSLAFEPDRRLLALAEVVRRQVLTGILTNNPPMLREALPQFLPELTRGFDPIVFSYTYRVTKPSEKLYAAVVQSIGIAAAASLLIDDSLANVQAAVTAGWQAIHYQTPCGLREALCDRGLMRER